MNITAPMHYTVFRINAYIMNVAFWSTFAPQCIYMFVFCILYFLIVCDHDV